jgi:SAM-dependent methyltransferase
MQTITKISELAELHKQTYDALAGEYERRTNELIPVTEEAVLWMAKYLPAKGRILDLGCGVGLATDFFMKNGFEVVCLDISSKMIEYAKERNPGAQFFQEDFLVADFDAKFDGVFAFAFIHLFPKNLALEVLTKIYSILDKNGIFYVGSTKSQNSAEGYEVKKDYAGGHKRYRKHWTKDELKKSLHDSGFTILDTKDYADPFGKVWMDFIAQKK